MWDSTCTSLMRIRVAISMYKFTELKLTYYSCNLPCHTGTVYGYHLSIRLHPNPCMVSIIWRTLARILQGHQDAAGLSLVHLNHLNMATLEVVVGVQALPLHQLTLTCSIHARSLHKVAKDVRILDWRPDRHFLDKLVHFPKLIRIFQH